MSTAIRFDQVSKAYRLGEHQRALRDALAGWGKALVGRHETEEKLFWALRDVSFEVGAGEALGIIGPNGAGKTTTLKLLSRIIHPTSGQISIDGRLSGLIELGAGFHPDLTGRENVYLNGTILGLSRREVARRLDAIIAFAELEDFIDTPVKRYSSGMYVRLGFAVAAHVEPDILLVDEVLAVGDLRFRQRCIEHMRNLRYNGTTVLLVSHNMHQIRSLCDRALLLVRGQVYVDGEPQTVIEEYEQQMLTAPSQRGDEADLADQGVADGNGFTIARIEMRRMGGSSDAPAVLYSDEPAALLVDFQTSAPIKIGRVYVEVVRTDGILCSNVDSRNLGLDEVCGTTTIEISYHPLQLATGEYRAAIGVTDPSDSQVIASRWSSRFRVVKAGGESKGIYVPEVRWAMHSAQRTTPLP